MFSESNIVNIMFFSILQYSIALTSNSSLSACLKGINTGEEVKGVKTTFITHPWDQTSDICVNNLFNH